MRDTSSDMQRLTQETQAILADIQSGHLDGLEERLVNRQRLVEAFFSSADSLGVEASMLRAWIEEIQRMDAEAMTALNDLRSKLQVESVGLKRGIKALSTYQAASDLME